MEHTVLWDVEKIHLAHEFVLDRIHKCEYRKGRGLYGLVYVISGEAQYRFVSGEVLSVRAGSVLFISPTSRYTIVCDEQFLHYTVNFSMHESVSLPPPCLHLEGEQTVAMARIFKRLVVLWREKEVAYELLCIGLLYELLAHLYREHSGRVEQAYHRLLPARDYIESHFTEDFSLATLATLSCMSLTNFRREWHRYFTESPMGYRDTLRLSLAKEYLSSGYYTVGEVAQKCGYEDTSYFVRFFKKKVGMTPKTYARSV